MISKTRLILYVGLLILGGLIGAWLSFSFRATSQTREAASPEKSLYVCGMHPQVIQDQPGNCPICGMALVPVSLSELKKIQPGGKVLYYTCPMPEHAAVHEDGPGKCPLCGMTLVPVMAPPDAPTNGIVPVK